MNIFAEFMKYFFTIGVGYSILYFLYKEDYSYCMWSKWSNIEKTAYSILISFIIFMISSFSGWIFIMLFEDKWISYYDFTISGIFYVIIVVIDIFLLQYLYRFWKKIKNSHSKRIYLNGCLKNSTSHLLRNPQEDTNQPLL